MIAKIKAWFKYGDDLVFSRCGGCGSGKWIHRVDLDEWKAHLYTKECLDCGRLEWWFVPGDLGSDNGPHLVKWKE